MNKRTTLRFSLLALAALPLRLAATDGRIPIATTPFTISAPGHYYLTRDLAPASGSNGVTVQASHVDLDLNGHTITVSGLGVDGIYNGGYADMRVHDGAISGGGYGVEIQTTGANSYRLERLTVSGQTGHAIVVSAACNATQALVFLTGLQVVSPAGDGIHLLCIISSQVSGNVVRGAGGYGIWVSNGSSVKITDNIVENSGNAGIWLGGDKATQVDGNSVVDCSEGIALSGSNGSTVTHNTIAYNTRAPGNGIHLSGNSVINALDGNTLSGNGGTGLLIEAGSNFNIYGGNRLSGNTAANSSNNGTGNLSGGGNCDTFTGLCN